MERQSEEKKNTFLQLLKSHPSDELLKEIGNQLSPTELSTLFELADDEFANEISTILISVPHTIFLNCLNKLNESDLKNIKSLLPTESFQHQIKLVGNHLKADLIELAGQQLALKNQIETTDFSTLGNTDLFSIEASIINMKTELERLKQTAQKTLGVCWNTNRPDLIELFSDAKEVLEQLLTHGIGLNKQENENPTGLYAYLEQHIFHIYSKGAPLEDLQDTDLAIEALAKFSIWNSQDYQAIHLSTTSHHPASLEEIKTELASLGLTTVKDLKQARIFSKKSLEEYISANRLKRKNHS